MVTKSIRLSNEEAADVREYIDLTGEVEASVLKRAMLRGLQEMRLDQAVLTYLRNGDSYEAAKIAGLPRAQFLSALVDRGVTLLNDPSSLREEICFLADALGVERLQTAVAETSTARAKE